MLTWRKSTRIAAGAGLATLGLLISGCVGPSGAGGSGDTAASFENENCTPSDSKNVGVLISNAKVGPNLGIMIQDMKDTADELGLNLNVQDGNGDIPTMLSSVRGFVSNEDDAIIVYPPDLTSLAPVLNEAGQAGIPSFALNLQQEEVPSLVTYVGPDNYDFGVTQTKILQEAFPDGAKIGLLMGIIGTSAQIERTAAIEDFVAENPQYEIVAQTADDWDPTKSLAITRDWLTTYPEGELDVIIAQGPHLGTSVENAISSGRGDVKWIFGDFLSDTVPLIESGKILGTTFQDMRRQAREVVQVTADWLNCDTDSFERPNEFIPTTAVTQENVATTEPEF